MSKRFEPLLQKLILSPRKHEKIKVHKQQKLESKWQEGYHRNYLFLYYKFLDQSVSTIVSIDDTPKKFQLVQFQLNYEFVCL